MTMSPVTTLPEREFHKNACNSAQYRNMPPGSYAYEKEEVRIEYGSGSPAAIQMWKSYKETIPIYDVAVVKEIPENVVQRDLFCEGVLYGPHPEEEIAVQSISFSNTEEHKQLPPTKICLNEVAEAETLTSHVPNREQKPESTKQDKQNQRPKIPLEGEPQSVLAEHDDDDHHPVCDVQQAVTQDSEENDESEDSGSEEYSIGLDTCPEKATQSQSVCNGELKVANESLWVEDSVQKFIPSPSWVAWIENQETNYDYDVYMSQRKQKRPSILSVTSEELSSRDEGSSIDNASVSYFVPDYMLRKGLYAFRRSAESSEKEKIQSGGSLKEDDTPAKHASSRYEKSCRPTSERKVKEASGRSRKIGVPIRGLNKRKLYSVKKKPRKSQSLSEPEDSEEYWVLEEENLHNFEDETDDEEYYFEEDIPREQLDFGKTNFFKQIAQQRILWKPPKGALPAHIIGWPVREKLRVKKSLSEALEQVHRLKPCDYEKFEKPERGYKEVPDMKKPQQKMGGKPQKKASGARVEEYWVGRGAKPKFTEPAYYLQDTAKIKEQDKPPKKKGTRKSAKRKQSRTDTEEIDAWEIPRSFLYRGCNLRKGGTRKK
ncbi:uncharacterized protein [Pyxicephalus adspersus]|uniref:uncharacterized protein n=1 Tax=Pyxicephalus adspersus TaxID=30357 RepID=UPI003B5904C0